MRIRLYGLLRDAAAHASAVTVDVCEGETVGSVLERLVTQYPRMRPLLFQRPGEIAPYVMIIVNGRDVRDGRGLAGGIGPKDEVALFPPSAGG